MPPRCSSRMSAADSGTERHLHTQKKLLLPIWRQKHDASMDISVWRRAAAARGAEPRGGNRIILQFKSNIMKPMFG